MALWFSKGLGLPTQRHSRPGASRRSIWADPLDDAVRGMASAFLVGIPLVFTVDSWWLGEQTGPVDALILLAVAYALTVVAVYWIGFRKGVRRGWEHFADALEALAIAILAVTVIYWTLGQIGDGQAASIAVGKIAVVAAPVALGVAVANHLLPLDGSRILPEAGDAYALRHRDKHTSAQEMLLELVAASAGALFISFTIVPVDDLNAIATEIPARNLPLVILLSLLVSYSVVYAAGFEGERARHVARNPLQQPLVETVLAYLVALCISLITLWLFDRISRDSAFLEVYTKTVLLAFPASMAAAAGRLAV